MCERLPLFLSKAKSILSDLLKRTLELLDLSKHFVEHNHLNRYLFYRQRKDNYSQLSRYKPCKLNYNFIFDLDQYLQRLSTTCRQIKSYLRLLHASKLASSNDYIVIDDDIYELIHLFKLKINEISIQSKDNQNILIVFQKISRLYQLLLKQLYGIYIVEDSHMLQPIIINIIRLLLLITNKLKKMYHINEIYKNNYLADSHNLTDMIKT